MHIGMHIYVYIYIYVYTYVYSTTADPHVKRSHVRNGGPYSAQVFGPLSLLHALGQRPGRGLGHPGGACWEVDV